MLGYQPIALVGRVFANGLGDQGSIPGRVISKLKKWYLILPCLILSTIRYISSVKWSNPPLHLSVLAIENGTFGSLLPTVSNFTFIYISLL